jgi:preprotein translocase subunit SecA
MDEPLLLLFGTDKIAVLMQKMGLGKDGAGLADPMIARAIRNAQSKVSAKITGSVPCRSQEEWFRVNLPSGI